MRLFIAVDLGEGVRDAVERRLPELKAQAPHARWLKPEVLHVTLAFLGEVDEEKVPALSAAVTEVAARHPKHTLAARGGGSFGSARRPRVLWIGLTGQTEALGALHADLSTVLKGLGLPLEERAFSPHLTLARAKDPRGDAHLAACVQSLSDFNVDECVIDHLTLFHSKLSPQGATHVPLVEAKLGG